MAVFTSSPVEARIHVGFMGKDLLPESLIEKIKDGHWTHVVAFRPTGGSRLPDVDATEEALLLAIAMQARSHFRCYTACRVAVT